MISQRESMGDYKTSGVTYFSILLYSHFTAYWKSLSSQSRIRNISGHIFFLKWLLFAFSCLSPRKLLLKYWNRKDHMSISSTRFLLSPIQWYRAVNPPSGQGSRVSKTTPCLVPSSLQYRGRYRSPRIFHPHCNTEEDTDPLGFQMTMQRLRDVAHGWPRQNCWQVADRRTEGRTWCGQWATSINELI